MPTPPTVIIAEPDAMISSALRVEFTHLNFAVFLAASSHEADDYAAQTVAHLIVLDAKLNLGAYEACARIRRRQGYATRPIVMTTNENSSRIRAASETAGATILLTKPYSFDRLLSAITPFLQPDDLLLTQHARRSGITMPTRWTRTPNPRSQSGVDSALTRNGLLLPMVHAKGVMIPLIRKP